MINEQYHMTITCYLFSSITVTLKKEEFDWRGGNTRILQFAQGNSGEVSILKASGKSLSVSIGVGLPSNSSELFLIKMECLYYKDTFSLQCCLQCLFNLYLCPLLKNTSCCNFSFFIILDLRTISPTITNHQRRSTNRIGQQLTSPSKTAQSKSTSNINNFNINNCNINNFNSTNHNN